MTTNVPLPAVVEALRPFIRSRQEVDQIRQSIRAASGVTAVNASTGISLPDQQPASLPSVHKAYWKALQAHRQAQAKYQALKTEVEKLSQAPSINKHPNVEPDLLRESYLPLLKQKEKQRKLATLERTFARIQSIGGDAVADSFDNVVRKEIGDVPYPPNASTFPERELDSYAGPDLTQLKQAILGAKRKCDVHQKLIEDIESSASAVTDPHTELQALQNAHNELTLWMETQLALISDVEPSTESGTASPTPVLENFGLRPGEDIASLYEQYLDARQKLLETILHPETAEIVSFDAPALQRRNSQKENEPRVPSEALLPYITRLVALRQQEQQLQQQSSHVRRQMSAAEDETKDVLARLVDESHLVAPSLNQRNASGQDWLKAAANDASATKSSALEKLAVGQASVKSAKAALAGITGLPESLDALA
ncbi:uncharacterized protein K489DRAFT_385222 [Dissoconium aciculare CBS 342.82]|uniref:Uncharacterized protein n=1 Tax=Dissoconium aciculare CBS 342.82 TaxID=1314786 RepID=A0A6J3LU11_9PEZI|nr:uncharacterized protein K489DRAFT_385222 [Dissoconium aciculare CBS 342.82]KAF1818107.1 hypothetical protein K489DRAFT_385222 [Dissoconium aciculare CBS 342.82]